MRATITVYGVPSSRKTDWLGQVKRVLLGTSPFDAVEVTMHDAFNAELGYGSQQFDEFTIPAAPVDGTPGDAGDRETWSVYWSPNGKYHVYAGGKLMAAFERQSDADLFVKLKCTTSDQWNALSGVLDRKSFYFNGERPLFTGGPVGQNCKGGGGESAEGAGAIPRGIYWSAVGGNFYDAITHRGQGATFYREWVGRRNEFPKAEDLTLPFAEGGKLSAAEAPAIHDCRPAPGFVSAADHERRVNELLEANNREVVRRREAVGLLRGAATEMREQRDEARRDAVELREERDAARRQRDELVRACAVLKIDARLADKVRKAFAPRAPMSIVAGGGEKPHIKIPFADLADSYQANDALLALLSAKDEAGAWVSIL